MTDRPPVMALVAALSDKHGWVTGTVRLVSLADAVDFAQAGWTVMVDPWDLEALNRHEQLSRKR